MSSITSVLTTSSNRALIQQEHTEPESHIFEPSFYLFDKRQDLWEASGILIPASHRDNPNFRIGSKLPGPDPGKYKHDQLFLCLVLIPERDSGLDVYHLWQTLPKLMFELREHVIYHDIRIALVLPRNEIDQRQPIPPAIYEFRNTLEAMSIKVSFDGSKNDYEGTSVDDVIKEGCYRAAEVHPLSLEKGIALPVDVVTDQIDASIAEKSPETVPIYIKVPSWARPNGEKPKDWWSGGSK